jgi:hypothetical protein
MTMEARLAAVDWAAVGRALDEEGHALIPALLTPEECASLAALFAEDARFRSRIDMARYRFGVGEYKYFARPLPPLVEALRAHAYPPLAALANRWMAALGARERFPDSLEAFLRHCHARGQTQPTPLLLRYEAGGYNCLHQDLYGDVAFPLQLTAFLSRRDVDYAGGRGDRDRPGRRARLPDPLPARARGARLVPRRRAPRREPAPDGVALRPRRHLPRREVSRPRSIPAPKTRP